MGSGVATLATLSGRAGIIKLVADDKPGYGLALIVGTLFAFLATVAVLSRLWLSSAGYTKTLLKEVVGNLDASSSSDR